MRYARIGAILGVALAVSLSARAQDRAATEKQIIASERAVNEAFMKRDAAGFKKHLSADAFGVDPDGGVVTVADWEKMMGSIQVDSWNMENPKVHWINPAVAILTYRATQKATANGQSLPSAAWCSSTWVKQNGAWKAAFHQESAIPEAAASKRH